MSKEYVRIGPPNSKQTLPVCNACLYRKCNQSKPMGDVLAHVCLPNLKPGKGPRYDTILDSIWSSDKRNPLDHQCNHTYALRKDLDDKLKKPLVSRPCAGALLTLYKLRGTSEWTAAMEAKWQAGEFPAVMVTDPEAIGK